MTPSERQAKSRQARKEAGGWLIQVMLSAKAATCLRKLMGEGKRVSEVVNELMERSR